MDAPKCRLCGTMHWKSRPCKFVSSKVVVSKTLRSPTGVGAEVLALRKEVAELREELEGFKSVQGSRKAYMREYMAKRRKNEKKKT